jgi:hypothetical protein
MFAETGAAAPIAGVAICSSGRTKLPQPANVRGVKIEPSGARRMVSVTGWIAAAAELDVNVTRDRPLLYAIRDNRPGERVRAVLLTPFEI